jgi:oxaloacetate decarboxylase alpha subunit/pyruvate carboxylase subunit B
VINYVQPMPGAAPAAFAPAASPAPAPAPATAKPAPAPKDEAPKAAPVPAAAVDGTSLLAPMPGMIIKFEINVGDEINEGETAVILEAMKMENALPAPASGTVKAINFSSGDSVAKGDVLCVIG